MGESLRNSDEEERTIKGPGHRNKFDVRRVWECPVCLRRVRSGGHIVNLRCDCRVAGGTGPAVWMKLVEGSRPLTPDRSGRAPSEPEVNHVHGNLDQE
jgi:hypothetical protein